MTSQRSAVTMNEAFDARRNSLNAIRLVLALLVIVSHSWPIGGYGADPGFGDQDLGDWAVAGFFAISGYLITMSRVRTSRAVSYYWRRFLRIYPAYIVATIIVAVVLAPLSALITGTRYNWGDGIRYIVANAAVMMRQWGIDGTLESNPHPITWNGSAWTLFHELLCYLVIGIMVSLIPRRFLTLALWAGFVATMAIGGYALAGGQVHDFVLTSARLGGFFVSGAIVYQHRERLRVHWALFVIASLATVVAAAVGAFQILAGLPVAYMMMYLGIRLPLSRIGARNDLSYGVYIYAFPVQQLLVAVLLQTGVEIPVAVFILASIALTLPFAAASWFLIERPAHRLKNLFAARKAEQAVVDPQPGPTQPSRSH